MQRKVVLAVVLVLLCGVSAYMWVSNSGAETDSKIAQMKETWKCAACGKEFELTTAEARAMLQAPRHEIVCPHCDEGGAEREGPLVSMSGGLPAGGGGDVDDQPVEEEEEERPPRPGGTMGPVERP